MSGGRSKDGSGSLRFQVGATVLAVFALGSCRGSEQAGDATSPGSAPSVLATSLEARATLLELRGRLASPLAEGVASGFESGRGGIEPKFSATGEALSARVTFPAASTGAVHVEDVGSGLSVDVTLKNARLAAARAADGYLIYAGGHASGATILHRALPSGAEDFLSFETAPATTEVEYTIALGGAVRGLRLVGGSVELLDEGGAPRLRVSPPYLVGADGAETEAVLALAGCAADNDPASPWGRPVTAPGADSCTLRVSWPAAGVRYPAVLDPRWTTAHAMGTARQEHTATLLSTGRVLVAGGRSGTGTAALASAELYDRTTDTWAATGSMTGARRLASAVQLGTTTSSTTSGKVLVAGGIDGTTSTNTAQLYSPSAGTWTAAGNLNAARHGHTATVLGNGRVLVTGGLNGTTTLNTAAVYNPASGAGSWAATTGPLPSALKNHTATLLVTSNAQLNNKVLVAGGNNGTATQSGTFLFDPVQSAFSTLAAMPGPREGQTATVLANGKLLLAGGKNGSTTLATAVSFDPGFGPGSWSSAGTMNQARSGHSATLLASGILSNGQVLIAGGSNGTSAVASAELFSGTNTWTTTTTMPAAVQGHTATLVTNGMVLIAGGINGTTVQTAARLYDPSFALPCTTAAQCATGFCANGVCCDTACTTNCGACNLAGKVGTCSPLPTTTTCRPSAGVCDVAENCNGTSLTCPADGFVAATVTCRNAAGPCDVAEKCTGTSASCPTDAFLPPTTTCRSAAGPCDVAESCTGTSASCPTDAFLPPTTTCRASAGPCDIAESCSGASAACPADQFQSGTVCRFAAGPCDVAEVCPGNSASCPTDQVLPPITVCRGAAGVCDAAEFCDGSTTQCPPDAFLDGRTTCRLAGGPCDIQEQCPGNSPNCPPDQLQPPSTVCRPAAGVCDAAEFCDGSTTQCPPDVFLDGRTTCRPAGQQCDLTEVCPGSSPNCPPDAKVADGTSCQLPNANAVCTGGACTRTSCQPGFEACDPSNQAGCESLTSAVACGACGNTCVYGDGTVFCEGRSCACTANACETCNDQHTSMTAASGSQVTLSGYTTNPGEIVDIYAIFQSLDNPGGQQVLLNPVDCFQPANPSTLLGSTTSSQTAAFTSGQQSLYPWSKTLTVPTSQFVSQQVGNATIFPPGGLARLVVEGGALDLNLTAAVFEDSACAGEHLGDSFADIARKCASASLIVPSCPGGAYQVVTLVDSTLSPTDSPLLVSVAPFCPDQRGHYIYGFLTNEEPNLSPGCDYGAEANLYYSKIDPSNARDTLDKFKTANNYSEAGEINAIYYNSGDLGVGRDMHCWKLHPNDPIPQSDAAACYVTNYGASFVDPPVSVDDALAQVIERNPANIAATVAMEYHIGPPDPLDPVRFFVYGPDGRRINAVKLDSEGPKPVPGNCITCHGGKYDAVNHIVGGSDNTDGGQFPQRATFLPFDPCSFTYSTQHPYTRADQEEKFRLLNSLVRDTRPEKKDAPGITAMIFGMYGHDGGGIDTPGQSANSNWVPVQWESAGLTTLYRDVVKPYCRTCHSARSVLGDANDPANNPSFALITGAPTFTCASQTNPATPFHHFMPHAEATMKRFWKSSARAVLVNALNDGSLASAAAGGVSTPGVGLTCSP